MATFMTSPSAFRDARLTAGPHHGNSNLRFDPALEAEYVRSYLTNSRTLVLVASIAATLLAILRGTERVLVAGWDSIHALELAFCFLGSIALVAIAWSSMFERVYLPWARIIVPARNIICAWYVIAAVSAGQYEMLMVMPLALIGPFFFLGFTFRMGLICGVLTSATFIAHAMIIGLATPLAVRSSVLVILGLVACAVAARHLDKWSRTAFLEARANADLAQHDSLTGTKNRRVFDEHLVRLWSQASADRRPLAVLLIDVDHFKAYNDRYGHQAGDQALRRVAQSVQTFASRPLDILARYGGEEFAAVLYDTDAQQGAQVAERMRRAVEDLHITHQGSPAYGRVTISIGVAALKPTAERNAEGALQLADQALYDAKTAGRNSIRLMSDSEHRLLVTGVFAKVQRA